VTARIPEGPLARIEIAAEVWGLSRSAYIRLAAVEAAERDLARLARSGGDDGEGDGRG